MLYTLMRSPCHSDMDSLLRLLTADDDLLLLQDGVLAALIGSRALAQLQNSSASLFVLSEDVAARGINR